jgi:hypothetical protein
MTGSRGLARCVSARIAAAGDGPRSPSLSRRVAVRLLGLGHFHWFPMVVWLLLRLDSIPAGTALCARVIGVVAVCSLSLVIDVVDIIRYLCGEREPTVVLPRTPPEASRSWPSPRLRAAAQSDPGRLTPPPSRP